MTNRRPSLAERLAEHDSIRDAAEFDGATPDAFVRLLLGAIADVGGVVHDSNMDSNDGVKP